MLAAMVLVLTTFTACGPSPGEQFEAAERASRTKYDHEYRQWLASDVDDVLTRLVEVRGAPFSAKPPSEIPRVDAPFPTTLDPALFRLLSKPEWFAALELEHPRKLSPTLDTRKLIGEWRCADSDRLRTDFIGHAATGEAGLPEGPRVPCSALESALVLREGTTQSGWLLMLPNVPECPWLSIEGEARCVESMHAWLAASIIGAQSRWDRFVAEEAVLVPEMLSQPQAPLMKGMQELIGLPQGQWSLFPPAAGTPGGPLAPPSADYVAMLARLGNMRPPAVLPPHRTYLAHTLEESASELVRLWDGEQFVRLRLRPEDRAREIVVVQTHMSRPLVTQIEGEGRVIYLDVAEHRAFTTFQHWVDFRRAHTRVLRRKFDKQGHVLPEPNVAGLPFG